MDIVGLALFFWSVSINGILALVGVHTYYSTGHPGPAAAVFAMLMLGQGLIFELFVRRILCERLPLETLHLPLWWRLIVVFTWPPVAPLLLGNMEAKYLARAKDRAAMLIREAGYKVPAELTQLQPF